MVEKEIEDKIALEISKAKLDVSEKRLNYAIAILGILFVGLGVIYPFYITKQNTKKIDNAIIKMKLEFDKAVGHLMKEPEINIYCNDKILENETELFKECKGIYTFQILIENSGNKKAENIKVYLFTKNNNNVLSVETHMGWQKSAFLKELGYNYAYAYEKWNKTLDAKEHYLFTIHGECSENIKNDSYLFKIYYGRENPTVAKVNIIFK